MNKLLGILLILFLVAGGYVYLITRDLPSVNQVLKEGISPTKGTQVFGSDGTVILSYGKFRHQNTKLADVSSHFIDALISTEDRRFYQHKGVDLIAVGRAIFRDLRSHRLLEGGSTLTQQLARNVFISNERSFNRKIREAVMAMKLEKELSKEQILELYLNNIYFGEGAYGIQAASEIYFNKKPSQLSVDEAALLAGMPQAPSLYSPFHNPQEAKKRREEVLNNMVETGKLSSDEAERYSQKRFLLNPSGMELASGDRAPFFNRYILKQIQEQFDLDEQTFWQSGLKIYTTLDPQAQALASRAVWNQSLAYGRTGKKQQASLLSLNPKTGGILAYVGGKSYSMSQFDRVSQALRSPGSLFKIFTYTTAIDHGYEPSRVYLDEPLHFGGWTPENFDKGHHGYMTIARALAESNNIIAVKVLQELTPPTVIDMAHRMGLKTDLENNLTLTLGGSGVTLLDMVSAFGVLANQGVRTEPYGIEKVTDAKGKVLYQHQPVTTDILNRTTVDTMISMMMGVIQHGTGKAGDIGRPMAGKTGTSDSHRDAWFIAYTPDVITGVWVGNDDNTPMPGITGGALPASIWKAFMRPYMANKPVTNFDLEYSKPLSQSDFSGYDIKNLSNTEQYDPNAVDQAPTEPSELPPGEGTLEGENGTEQPGTNPSENPSTPNNSGDLTQPQTAPVGPPSPSIPAQRPARDTYNGATTVPVGVPIGPTKP